MNLREKHGFTYGAYSNVGTGRFQSNFRAYASVRNEKVDSAVGQFLYEINRIRTQKISAEELQNAKNQFNGAFALGMENIARTADFASNIIINKLPADFYRTYLQKINAVRAEDIQRVAQKYFNYNNTRVIVVGRQDKIEAGLKKLGYPVKLYDKYADPITVAGNTAKVDLSAQQILENYIKVIGGKAALENVKSIASTGNMEAMGQKLPLVSKKMAPNKELFQISMAGNPVMKSVYDGTAGYQMQMGQKQDMSAEDLNDKKSVKGLFEQLYYSGAEYKLQVKGLEKVGTADAYVLLITLPSGKTRTEYYDTKTGFLVKASETTKENGAEISQTMEFSDYRKTGDILVPYSIVLNVTSPMGSQELVMKIDETKLNEGVTDADFK
jgi:hypothetical protein